MKTNIEIRMTSRQIKEITNAFELESYSMYGLIAQPLIKKRTLEVRLLTEEQFHKINNLIQEVINEN
jgi:hypothetical protein